MPTRRLRPRQREPRDSDCSGSAVAPAASGVQASASLLTRRRRLDERPTFGLGYPDPTMRDGRPAAPAGLRHAGPGGPGTPPATSAASRISRRLRSRRTSQRGALILGSGCSRRATHPHTRCRHPSNSRGLPAAASWFASAALRGTRACWAIAHGRRAPAAHRYLAHLDSPGFRAWDMAARKCSLGVPSSDIALFLVTSLTIKANWRKHRVLVWC